MSKSNELPSKRQEEIAMPETKAKPSNFTQISNEVLLDKRLATCLKIGQIQTDSQQFLIWKSVEGKR